MMRMAIVWGMAAGMLAWSGSAGAAPAGAVPLLDLEASTQELTLDSFQVGLVFEGIMPGGKALVVSATRDQGRFYPTALGTSPRYNQAQHAVDPSGLDVSPDGRISGPVHVTVRADRWVPPDGKPWDFDFTLAGRIDTSADDWTIAGTWEGTVAGEAKKGAFAGTFDLAKRNNHWNVGRWRQGGVALHFDLGTERVNWNKADHAVCIFRPARDLREYRGLWVSVETDQPRGDAEVAVFLGEEDGSWYYVPRAVPLVEKTNAAELPFESFDVAEWVAPGNHMDEDYLLDLGKVGAIAIGVVNPFGVGEVGFRVTGIDLLPKNAAAEAPAAIDVTGRLLSVNGHEVVPAGIFGGFAGDLARKYRPGCQRNLYAGSYPRIPLQSWAAVGSGDFTDWPAALRALRGDTEAYKAISTQLRGLLGVEKRLERLQKFDIDRHIERTRQRDRDPARAPKDLTEPLSVLLRHRGFYEAKAWADVKGAAEILERFGPVADLNESELMERNRHLLVAALPGIKPLKGPKPTEMFWIDCLGERKEPAWFVSRQHDWRGAMEGFGRRFAENARAAGCNGTDGVGVLFELWNEPYLHWGSKDRVNLHTKYYRTDLAKEGGPVMVKRTDDEGSLIEGEIVPHFKWVRGDDPKGLKEAHEGLYVADETAFTFWSGAGNGWIYDQMFGAVGKAIKETNPNVEVAAGWGFRWHEDHWAAWDILYQNTIDRGIQWIDGVHEHHYQGQTTGMQAAYEFLTAYGVTVHDKWLYSYNTETNDLIDSPARGAVDTPEKARASLNYRRGVYNLRDLLYSVQETPDKARARTVIHSDPDSAWTDVPYSLLANLRGRLVHVRRDDADPSVWAVASVDGTDPEALPLGETEVRVRDLVVVVFNDNPHVREVQVDVAPPTGTRWAGPPTFERTEVDAESFQFSRVEEKGPETLAQGSQTYDLELLPQQAWKVTIPLEGTLPEKPEVVRTQAFSRDLLATVTREEPFRTRVQLDPAVLKAATGARLRVVVEDVGVGEGMATVCGQEMPLPVALSPDNVPVILDVPLDVTRLRPDCTIAFTTADSHAGYRVDMTSVVLETAGP